jgi:coatomer subunit beta'
LVDSKVNEVVDAWRTELKTKGRPKIAAAIASPAEHAELFDEGWENALAREQRGAAAAANGDGT